MRLSFEAPKECEPISAWARILKRAALGWAADSIPTFGAALAYYGLFSLVPLLVIALAVVGFVYRGPESREHVVTQLENLVGKPAGDAMEHLLENAERASSSGLTILAIGVLLVSASGAFVALQDGINAVWKKESRSYSGILHFLRVRLLSILAVIGTAAVLLASLILNAVLYMLARLVPPSSLPQVIWIWQTINLLTSIALVSGVCAAIYKFMPEARVAWRDVWAGSVLTGVLFAAGKHLFGFYLSHAGVTTVFGAAGSLVVILLWVYYSSVIFFFGAEVTHAYAHEVGSLRWSKKS